MYGIVSRYENIDNEFERKPLYSITKELFTVLGSLVNKLVPNKENYDTLYLLHLVCKVFFKYNRLILSPYLIAEDMMNPWMSFFKIILDMPCPADLSSPTSNTEEIIKRDKTVFWKIKGVVAKNTYLMFVKYSDPMKVTIESRCDVDLKGFATKFAKNYSIPLLESHL